jgi:hypothetical protein
MARVNLTRTFVVGPYPALPPTADSLDVVFTAADTTNKEEFVMSGNDVLLVWNTGASAYTFTLNSVADDLKRVGDISAYSLGAGEIAAFKFTNKKGWMQSDGRCRLEANNTAIKFAVLKL